MMLTNQTSVETAGLHIHIVSYFQFKHIAILADDTMRFRGHGFNTAGNR